MNALIERYSQGPALLRAAVAGTTQEQLTARPVPGKWSTLEVVAHLADFEPVLADRIRRVAAMPKPLLLAADENLYSEHLSYQDRDLEAELKLIEGVRGATAVMLAKLPAEAFARQGIHNEKGLVTLESILTGAGNHIYNHLVFIHDKRKALGI